MARTSSSLNDFFDLHGRGSNVTRELRGAVATFLTMAYILFVNPSILANAGMPADAQRSLVACTALAAGVCCILMGLFANFPLAMASGMGLNAVVVGIALKSGSSWQIAMGVIVLDGLVTLLLVLGGLREAILHAIPQALRLATGAGIGLFIALIGLVNAKIVVATNVPAAPLGPGSWRNAETVVALCGLLITVVLTARRVRGALVIGIIAATLIALFLRVAHLPEKIDLLPSFAAAFHADVMGALKWKALVPILFAVIMVDFFDTLGTATAIAEEAGLIDSNGRIPRIRQILIIDSLSASIGGMLGTSSVTAYIESAAGVAEGARTGLHSVFVGILFLAAIILAPIAGIVPAAATAPALILVGFLMMAQAARIDFDNLETATPAFLTLITIPLTYSIAHGIGYGFIAYVAIKLLALKPRDVHPLMYLTAAAFAAYFILA
jgi:AGZA family xanthine/uracil permease-like MFS transporter